MPSRASACDRAQMNEHISYHEKSGAATGDHGCAGNRRPSLDASTMSKTDIGGRMPMRKRV